MTHFPSGKPLPLYFFQSSDEVSPDQSLFSTFDLSHLQLCWAKVSLELANCPIYLLVPLSASTRFPKRPRCFHLFSHFILFVFASDEKIAVIIGQVHTIPITCQSFHLSPGFQTLPLSQINELCLAFLISPTSFCLPMFLLPHCSWQILSLVRFFFPLLWLVLVHHQSYRSGSIVKVLCCTAWAPC